ncbi:MAG: NAD(P)-dependent glycerol-3-phosphate dehydrogenase [Kiritimatiellae bacterium]|nr:NAD(P)-dependent glycerol-3-phosphate dehydrogenase [Kiritimatiellia bacterium]
MIATIIGDGGWGTALACVLRRNGHTVRIWGPFPDYIAQLRGARENPKFLPGTPLPDGLEWTSDPAEAVRGTDLVVLAVPSQYFAETARKFAPLLPANARRLSVTKGLDAQTLRRMTEVAGDILGGGPVAALSGPSFAEEVARRQPTAVVAACRDPDQVRAVQAAFNSETFRVYTSDDVIGVELGGALKNVIALAAGACDGLDFGYNTKAALVTRGLAEITRLGLAMGARARTFSGLSGIGDLMLTCMGRLSRNRAFGERLGRGERAEDILRGMTQVAEGAVNCRHACGLAARAGVDMPIAEAVRRVVEEHADPREAVRQLMTREPRPEHGPRGGLEETQP